jgi:hypothetical protein
MPRTVGIPFLSLTPCHSDDFIYYIADKSSVKHFLKPFKHEHYYCVFATILHVSFFHKN